MIEPKISGVENRATWLEFFFLLSTIAGIAALFVLMRTPSMERNVLLWGLSASRLLVAVIAFLLLLPFLWATWRVFTHPGWRLKTIQQVDALFLSEHCGPVVIISVFFWGCLNIIILALFARSLPEAYQAYTLQIMVQRLSPVLMWFALMAFMFLAGAFLWHQSLGLIHKPYLHFRLPRHAWLVLFAWILLTVVVSHWIILVFRLGIFTSIPGWFWSFHPKPFSLRDLVFLVLLGAFFVIMRFVMRHPRRIGLNLLLLVALGYGIQVAFGIMDGQGFESLRLTYMNTAHRSYAMNSNSAGIWQILTDYETRFSQKMFLGTKPPGLLVIYSLFGDLADRIIPVALMPDAVTRLTTLAAYIFPLVSFLVLPVLFWLSRRLLEDEKLAYLPLFFYISLPNVILIPLLMDQVLYPLFFTVGLFAALRAMRGKALGWGIALGIWFYLVSFISFSMLPLLPLVLLWAGLDFWVNRRRETLMRWLNFLLGAFLGGVFSYIVLYAFIGYNFIERYTNAFAGHRALKDYSGGAQVFSNAFLNMLDFSSWVGFSLILLVVLRILSAVGVFYKRGMSLVDTLAVSFTAMFLALNLAGQTRGEVGRLWIFMTPVVCLLAASEIPKLLWFKKESRFSWVFWSAGIIVLQLVTMLLIFKFQDF